MTKFKAIKINHYISFAINFTLFKKTNLPPTPWYSTTRSISIWQTSIVVGARVQSNIITERILFHSRINDEAKICNLVIGKTFTHCYFFHINCVHVSAKKKKNVEWRKEDCFVFHIKISLYEENSSIISYKNAIFTHMHENIATYFFSLSV